uniref:Lipase domain-containing protein n=1 Tax=Anopheles quadriannulatus TaxID=34691 RepID=A0A904A6K7_ANOQN
MSFGCRRFVVVPVVVAFVLFVGLAALAEPYRDGKFGARLAGRIRERRLERAQLRAQRLQRIASNEAFAADYAMDFRDEMAADSTTTAGDGEEDYSMNVTTTVGVGEEEEVRRPPPLPPALLAALKPSPRRTMFEGKITFRFYHGGNLTKHTTLIEEDRLLNGTGCAADERFALIVHGWRENCYEVPWVLALRDNLHQHRGGCVACMDYSAFSSGGYGGLVGAFRDIRDVLMHFLQQLRYEGVQFGRTFVFGFSFGAQLALDVGSRIGGQELEAIDTCDMAGPGFDSDRAFKVMDFRNAAKNVQCVHTSIDKGTKFPNKCHQNWRMGQCGLRQAAAGPPPLGSHGLCPVFYNLAFKYQFLAQPKPLECVSLGEVATYPRNYRMGYMETRKSEVRGELFAQTSDVFPYTVYTNPYNIFDYGF